MDLVGSTACWPCWLWKNATTDTPPLPTSLPVFVSLFTLAPWRSMGSYPNKTKSHHQQQHPEPKPQVSGVHEGLRLRRCTRTLAHLGWHDSPTAGAACLNIGCFEEAAIFLCLRAGGVEGYEEVATNVVLLRWSRISRVGDVLTYSTSSIIFCVGRVKLLFRGRAALCLRVWCFVIFGTVRRETRERDRQTEIESYCSLCFFDERIMLSIVA